MATFKQQQLISIFDRYATEVSSAPARLDDVAACALEQRLYSPTLKTLVQLCRNDLAESLRQEKREDAAGNIYRAKISVRQNVGGTQLSLWADADLAPRSFVERSVHQKRRGIADDCYQLKQDVDHFNATRGGDNPMQLVLDFTDDVAELEAARRVESAEGAA